MAPRRFLGFQARLGPVNLAAGRKEPVRQVTNGHRGKALVLPRRPGRATGAKGRHIVFVLCCVFRRYSGWVGRQLDDYELGFESSKMRYEEEKRMIDSKWCKNIISLIIIYQKMCIRIYKIYVLIILIITYYSDRSHFLITYNNNNIDFIIIIFLMHLIIFWKIAILFFFFTGSFFYKIRTAEVLKIL